MFESHFIIAEIGSNWCKSDVIGDNYFNALYQIEQAKECGANAVKFQLFTHKDLYGFDDPEHEINKYAIPREWIPKLKTKCDKEGIEFMCSCFSIEAYEYINQFVNIHKVAAPESDWKELRDKLEEFKKPIIVSVDSSLNLKLVDKISVGKYIWPILTVSQYPANPIDYYNMMTSINNGISDHTKSMYLIQPALDHDHTIFEVHVDLSDDTKIKTPDSSVSLNKKEFIEYIDRIHKPYKYDACKPNHQRIDTKYGYYRQRARTVL